VHHIKLIRGLCHWEDVFDVMLGVEQRYHRCGS
jgi:hypothetical protein